MRTVDWPRVRDIFEAVVDLPGAEQQQALDARCGGDAALRAEVASLLRHHTEVGAFLDVPLDVTEAFTEPELAPGTRLGPYDILRTIGQGGMGQVYLARDTRLGRHVCLKSVRPDLAANPVSRERLTREARIADSVSHPGI